MFVASVDSQLERMETLALIERGEDIRELAAAALEADPGMEATLGHVDYATALMAEFISTRPAAVRAELD
jgi:hypothetical protein